MHGVFTVGCGSWKLLVLFGTQPGNSSFYFRTVRTRAELPQYEGRHVQGKVNWQEHVLKERQEQEKKVLDDKIEDKKATKEVGEEIKFARRERDVVLEMHHRLRISCVVSIRCASNILQPLSV